MKYRDWVDLIGSALYLIYYFFLVFWTKEGVGETNIICFIFIGYLLLQNQIERVRDEIKEINEKSVWWERKLP